jgi:phospholipid transport system substrate-binding protein
MNTTNTVIRRSFLGVVLAMLFLAFAGQPVSAADAEADAAKKFIESLSDQAVQSLTQQSAPRSVRIDRFRKMFNDTFNVEGIGQWILGRYWRAATPEEQKEYLDLFEDLMVASYVDRFARYSSQSIKIGDAQKAQDGSVNVPSRIDNPSGQPIRIDWRVVKVGGNNKIADVVVEGTSMSTTLRSEFGSIINQKGGKVSGLLEVLREKTKTLNQ